MIISILQPGYLPWLGFFEQLHRSDVFIVYDSVQYDKNGWRNRNKIKTAKGSQWLTVPALADFNKHQRINEVKIDNRLPWKRKHLAALKLNYSKTPFFERYIDIFEEAYTKEWERLVDIDMHFIVKLSECLGVDTDKIKIASELHIEGGRIDRLVNLCKKFNADTFYEGCSGRNYINEGEFLEKGIKVVFQDYKHPVYSQPYGEFVPNLSIVDLLMNCGPKSLEVVITSCGK